MIYFTLFSSFISFDVLYFFYFRNQFIFIVILDKEAYQ